MKYNGKIKHPKDLVTKEFVENFVENKLNESSTDKIKSRDNEIVGEVIDDNLYLGGKNG